MKIIPIFLFVLLYVACKPTIKVSQPQPKRKNADIVGTYVDKFGRTLKLLDERYFEYYCPNVYLGDYKYVDDSTDLYLEDTADLHLEYTTDLYAEDSADFYSPCVPATGVWSFNYDKPDEEIFLTTFTYSNLGLFRTTPISPRNLTQNGMIVRQSNKLQDSFIVQVELSQDLPQRGYLWVYISAFIDDKKQAAPFPKVDSIPYLRGYDSTDYGYYSFRFSVDDLEEVAANKFRFAVPKISPKYVLTSISVNYKTDYPIDFRHINITTESKEKDSLYIPIQSLHYELPYGNSIHEVDILMYPTHAANWRETVFRFDKAGNIIGTYPVVYNSRIAMDTAFGDYFHAPHETIYYRQK